MRGIRLQTHGGAELLVPRELPDPDLGPCDVIVDVRAVGVNHLDLWVRRGVPGHRFPLPLIPGSDVAGQIEAVGAAVTGLSPGDEVIVAPGLGCGACVACLAGADHRCRSYGILGESRDGGYADRLAVPARNIVAKPAGLSFVEAAAIGIPFLTAWHMLVARAELRPGEAVLVQAGGSGVGVAAIQIARLWGAEVIATAGSDAKAEAAARLGARVIDARSDDVAGQVKRLTAGRGVDVIVDHVGTDTWATDLAALAWHGRLVVCGATTGAEAPLNLRQLFFKSWSVLGSTMGSLAEFHTVVGHAAAGRLRPQVAEVLPLAEAARAHGLLEERRVFGKLVLVP